MADISVERAPRRTPLALAALAVAIIALLMLFLSGPGTRFGMWDFRTGFQLMRYAAYAGIAAAVLSLVALALTRGRGRVIAAVALVMAAVAWFMPWNARRGAMQYPPIHDITTDTRNPPVFVAVAPLRQDAPNPVEYLGDSIAAQQQQAYPDIRPMMMAMPVDSAFSLALRTARGMGWELVDQNRREGRIEATATTPWFGFKDDVVIRVSSASGISRVDVRSKSRVGRGDVGANAKRIRAYMDALRAADPNPITDTQ
ncbi:DUF1499 domain-containing protein [Longimicrobium sp.]|uniref:DUF1499 domain-containing protein n=1 Tax=Longimicrobium sp. TaxID=2029185 RepID=UPI002E2F8BA6|nr:DUF1499 domain-containing protein [Longimicrobium sp.]HEX6038569.1 DUF1499 domain-containing protein [Longimicrobium sp.]